MAFVWQAPPPFLPKSERKNATITFYA